MTLYDLQNELETQALGPCLFWFHLFSQHPLASYIFPLTDFVYQPFPDSMTQNTSLATELPFFSKPAGFCGSRPLLLFDSDFLSLAQYPCPHIHTKDGLGSGPLVALS